MKTIILLTACVNPAGMAYTVLQDSEKRLLQYIIALKFYLSKTDLPIVFCENTNYDISNYFEKEIKEKRLEILTFDGNNFDKGKGKGYGEALIIDHAIRNSKFINQSDRIIKITGRLIIENIVNLVRGAKINTCIYADIIGSDNNVCCSICFISPVSFLKDYFLPDIESLNDSQNYYFEHLLFEKCKSWKSGGYKWKEFYFPILIKGQSGSTGKEYIVKYRWLMYIKKVFELLKHKWFY